MDTLDTYRKIIENIFNEYLQLPYAYGNIEKETIIDREKDRYMLMAIGWDGVKRIHGCVVHIDIINGKLWIQRDGTEHGIAADLEEHGVPKDCIVLGFHAPDLRKYTEYATA